MNIYLSLRLYCKQQYDKNKKKAAVEQRKAIKQMIKKMIQLYAITR